MSLETREKEGCQSQSESLSPSLFAGLLCVSASLLYLWASLVAQTVKNLPAMQETRFNPWVRKIAWRREWQPTLVFLPGEFHGQRSLVSYRPLGHKESYMTEQLTHTHTHTHTHSVHTFCGPVSCIRPLHRAEMTFLGRLPLKLRFYIFRLALFLTSSSKISEKGSDWFATDQVSTINQSTVARIADLDPLGSTSP